MLQGLGIHKAGAEEDGEPSRSKLPGEGGTPALGADEVQAFGRWSGSQEALTGSLGSATADGRKAVGAKDELRMGSIPHGDGEVGRSKEAT